MCELYNSNRGRTYVKFYSLRLHFVISLLPSAFPPDIDEGDPDGTCPINPLFRFAQCKVGTNYCIPMNNMPSTYMFECLHKPPPAPATPTPQQAIWFLNGVQITTNTGSRTANTPSTVSINPVGKQLTVNNVGRNAVQGNYTCMLTNIAGSDVATSIITDCGELNYSGYSLICTQWYYFTFYASVCMR